MHFDLERRLDDEELAELEQAVRGVLGSVRSCVRDFPAMLERVQEMARLARAGASRYPADEVEEVVDFLAWLQRGEFVFLGAREYDFTDGRLRLVPGSGLGILGDEAKSSFGGDGRPFEELPEYVRRSALEGDLLLVDKSNAPAPVHRRERMDYIGVRRVDGNGEIVGMSRVIGLFTTKAYAEPASETPLLHRKLRQCLEGIGLIEGSHDHKAAVALFDTFPKDELFAAPAEDLRGALSSLLALEGTQKVRLLGRRDPDGRNASLILTLPQVRYDAALVERVRGLFRRRFGTTKVEAHHVLDDSDRARVHYLVHAPGELPELALRALEREVVELTRTWDDELRDLLMARHGAISGRRLAEAWLPRFPEHYKGYTTVEMAGHDVVCLARLTEGESHVVSLHPVGDQTRLCLYETGDKVQLSEAMPMLEDLGLIVLEEVATRLVGEEDEVWVQEFRVLGPDRQPLDVEARGRGVAEAIAAVWRGDAESDPLNRLVISAGLDRDQLAILRAYRKYRQRIGSRFTESYQNDVLAANPALTAKLVRYFEARFDPGQERDEAAESALREEITADLDDVVSLDHDRILRNQLGLIDATLRTNAYKPDRAATSFKLRSADVPAMPMPSPMFEIYVYSPEMEGIHLRGGSIARGGIRWSDRMDYRTEVYGLMRAQLTKNAIIVPAGAKGGFVLKRTPEGRAELQAEVKRQYIAYVRALLDLTDNLVDGRVVHPPDVRVLDDDDTYLVVAADKGTATMSDTANAIARDYNFWLDDAFASGGSAGYDHKKLGITARGAWESVKRHFREMGMDPEVDEFTVVGIGDMSGDVFGNGMLLSDKLKLLAAYDHRHVFIDPSPDAAVSFAERRRLFELPGSSWDDYDKELISAGGGVFPRSAKSIALSPEARAALDVEAERLTPTEVIQAILRARVDLLWNGGIGTVVKASTETDADAHDRSSDAIRVDARDLCARVVGEGGNLGFTRRARVEFSAARRADQRRLHRQLGRRRLLRPRGQPEDPARAGRAPRRDDPRRARRAAGGRHRRRGRARPLRLVPAGPDHRPGGRALRRAPVRLRGPDDAAGGAGAARPRLRGPSGRGGDRRAPARRARHGAPGAGGPGRLRQALGGARARAHRVRRGPVAGARPARLLPRRRDRALRAPAGRAPAAPRAAADDQRQLGRQRAGADVRLPAGGRARRRSRRGRPRLPDRPRGDGSGGALGRGRAPRGRRAGGAGRADGGHRPAGRGDHALVSRLAAERQPGRRGRRRARGLRAPGRGARRSRHRRAPHAPRRAR